jgi:anti-sigma-K factor RskA
LNIDEYIASGVLEAYALGELPEAERQEVQRLAAQHPHVQAELALVEVQVEQLLQQSGLTPRTAVKEKILDAVRPDYKVRTLHQPQAASVKWWQYAAAASIAVALASGYMAVSYWHNWKRSESNLADVVRRNQQIADDYNVVNQRLDKLAQDVAIIQNPAFQRVVMKGTAQAPQALALVYWNQSTQDVYLDIKNLKALSSDNQYQLWAIVDGKPVDMGVFDAQLAGLLKMKPTAKAAAFAVTIEPRGGRPSPTLETMQVVGNA